MTIKHSNLFVGKVVSEKAKLSEHWIVDQYRCQTDFTCKDSYGITTMAIVLFSNYTCNIVYNLNGKYSYLKCTISIYEGDLMDSNVLFNYLD